MGHISLPGKVFVDTAVLTMFFSAICSSPVNLQQASPHESKSPPAGFLSELPWNNVEGGPTHCEELTQCIAEKRDLKATVTLSTFCCFVGHMYFKLYIIFIYNINYICK